MKDAKSKAMAVLVGAVIGLGLSVGQARADVHDRDDTGEWWTVYDQDGLKMFDYCKCVEDANEPSPCETYVGTLSRHGITQPTYEQKKGTQ